MVLIHIPSVAREPTYLKTAPWMTDEIAKSIELSPLSLQ